MCVAVVCVVCSMRRGCGVCGVESVSFFCIAGSVGDESCEFGV